MSTVKKNYHRYIFCLLFCFYINALTFTVVAEDTLKWVPQINFNIKHGNKRDIGWIGAFAPILQTNDTLTYIDFRFMADTNQDQEGNFGLGYRWMNPDMLSIGGIYGYFDRRFSSFGNKYSQITFGAEYLSTTWDYRGNIYIPENKTFTNKTNTYETKIENLNRFQKIETVTTHLQINKEIPLKGLDAEIGRCIYGIPKLRLYLGGYYFHGRCGLASIKGKQVRSTYAFNSIVTLQAEFRHDNVRKKNYYIGLEINIPMHLNSGKDKRKSLTYIEMRMTEAPIRDVDIVSQNMQEQLIGDQESRIIPTGPRSSLDFNQDDSFFSNMYCSEIGTKSQPRDSNNNSRRKKKSQISSSPKNTTANSYDQNNSHQHSGNCCSKFTTSSASNPYRALSSFQNRQTQSTSTASNSHRHMGNCCQSQGSKSTGSKISPSQPWNTGSQKPQLASKHIHGAHCNHHHHGVKAEPIHVHKTDILKSPKKLTVQNKNKDHHTHDHKNCSHHDEDHSDLIIETSDDESMNDHDAHLTSKE